MAQLEKKLAKLPKTPGVYFHKGSSGEIIYIGKAANLRNRVRQYFQPSAEFRARDPKTSVMIKEIVDVDWIEVETEADALFLEAEQVRRYQPKFNILLRDDKSLLYIRIDYKSDYPTVTFIRGPLDDGAEYFGPYANGWEVKKALRYLRRAFPYAISRNKGSKRANLYFHLGLDPGLEEGRTSLEDYRANLRRLMQYLRSNRVAITREIEREMKRAARAKDFEQAAKLRNQLFSLRELNRQILFSDREVMDASRDHALAELAILLGLPQPPKRIEGFDISHMQGTDTTASMVVFINGVPEKSSYRKFKMRVAGNDDFAHIHEALSRRLSGRNAKKWGLPDLILIDGGKGQLQAALSALKAANLEKIPAIGLAKRFEDIILKKPTTPQKPFLQGLSLQGGRVTGNGGFLTVSLPGNSHLVKLLQRIRDESHRFAVSYHSTLKQSRQTSSLLDEIPGVGPITRRKLIRHFGSAKAVFAANDGEIIALLGKQKGRTIAKYLGALSQNI